LLTRNLRYVCVTDAEIADAMRLYFMLTHNVAEGAGAASLAAAIRDFSGRRRRVGVVLSGANVDRDLYARVLNGAE
jgi:threonine dehydratase